MPNIGGGLNEIGIILEEALGQSAIMDSRTRSTKKEGLRRWRLYFRMPIPAWILPVQS